MGRPLRILWLTNLQAPYREPVWAHVAARADLRVEFLAPQVDDRSWKWRPSTDYESAIVDTVRIPGLPTERALYIARRGLRGRIEAADVIVLGSWESPAYLQALWTARRLGKPTVLFFESTSDSHRFHSPHPVALVRRAIVNLVDSVFTVGQASTNAVEAMGVPRRKIVTGFNTVDVSGFHRAAREMRADFAPDDPGHTFLFVGRLIERKNIDALIGAFEAVGTANDRLWIVGDGVAAHGLQVRAAASGAAGSIEFFGSESGLSLLARYGRAHTLVLPSSAEVWGMVVNEALACGLHAVVSSRAGVAMSVRSMRGVYVTDPDPVHLADAMYASRRDWQGYIEDPSILAHTPAESGEHALSACRIAVRDRNTHLHR